MASDKSFNLAVPWSLRLQRVIDNSTYAAYGVGRCPTMLVPYLLLSPVGKNGILLLGRERRKCLSLCTAISSMAVAGEMADAQWVLPIQTHTAPHMETISSMLPDT